jgi:hypothetical protein
MSSEDPGDRVWIYEMQEFKGSPKDPLSEGLQWILEQMHFGNLEVKRDSDGRAVSLTIGRDAAPPVGLVNVDEVLDHAQNRRRALDISRIFAEARERGTLPPISEFLEANRNGLTEGAYGTPSSAMLSSS